MLPTARGPRPPLARLGASPERIARAYHGGRRLGAAERSWVAELADETRASFRTRGHDLVALLLRHLDAAESAHPAEAAAALEAAARLVEAYGRELAGLGVSLAEAVLRYVKFRGPFLDELAAVARRRGLDAREATGLLSAAGAATDRLLECLLAGHASAAPGPGVRS